MAHPSLSKQGRPARPTALRTCAGDKRRTCSPVVIWHLLTIGARYEDLGAAACGGTVRCRRSPRRLVSYMCSSITDRCNPLEVVTVPQPGWIDALVDAGFAQHIAEVMAELCDAEQRGILTHRGDRTVRCATELDETLAALVGVPA
ncbi:hypothetical protein BH23ACT8_BH23ACT8_02890 [soil metagenome]